MRSIKVELGNRSYPIYIEAGIINSLDKYFLNSSLGKKIMLVTDSNVGEIYGELVRANLAAAGFEVTITQVPAGENAKTLAQAGNLYDAAFEQALDRSCPIVALGGGVVGDLTGFVAATYMRGVPFIQMPTTLLAQVDSSVGGKVAVNHPKGKNIIGAFYQPKMVLIDVDSLKTLEIRELRAGLAEIIKYGVIWDAAFFSWLEENKDKLLKLDSEALIYAIETCCRIKAAVVEQDETEQGTRAILNYGHTVGHAIESLSGYGKYLHGEAVSIGMVMAGKLALARGLMTEEDYQRVVKLLQAVGLPTEMPAGLDSNEVLDNMYHDKKVIMNKLVFILPHGIGEVGIYKDIQNQEVLKMLEG